jgi:quercetin dioxygenase-like cupin family protein
MKRSAPLFDPQDVAGSELLNATLAEALQPIDLDPARAAPIRQRLLDRARASREADPSCIHVRIDDGEWRTLLKGVRIKSLSSGPGGKALLVELDPGASLPGHAHREHEECVVLRGELKLGALTVRQGDYHVAPAGSRHGRIESANGALIYLRGTPIGDGLAVARR